MIPGSANPLLLAPAAGGYQASRSLRFNSSDSGFCSRTPAVAGNRKTWTWAGWVKRSSLDTGTNQVLFSGGVGTTDTTFTQIDLAGTNTFRVTGYATDFVISSAVFRDASAWYHIAVAFDATQGTNANKLKVYINGSEINYGTDNRSSISNQDYGINQAAAHAIGRNSQNSARYFDGYLADIHFIDGQALTPSSFTEVSATTGQLIPKAYTGGYGTGTTVATATGALPIFNTTDTYGFVKGTGTRTDTNSASIALALPMDGTNGGTSFGDQSAVIKGSGSAKTVTVNGNTNTSTAISKFYGSSGYFDGTGDYLQVASSNDFELGSGDFTIEWWEYIPTNHQSGIVSRSGTTGVNGGPWIIISRTNGDIEFYAHDGTGPTWNISNGTVIGSRTLNSWTHWVIKRSGSSFQAYKNGIQTSFSVTSSASFAASSSPLVIGNWDGTLNGYLQDLRIYKGVAKYTSNFTPVNPTNSFYLQFADNSSNTASTLGKDTSGNSNNWTPNNFSVIQGTGNYVGGTYSANWSPGFTSAYLAFDNDLSTVPSYSSPNVGAGTYTYDYTLPTSISGVTLVEVYADTTMASQISVNSPRFNGSTVILAQSAISWKTIYSGSSTTFNSFGWQITHARSLLGIGFQVYGVRVNGSILIDYLVGAGNDSLVDTPTSIPATDTGVGGEIRGNYATLNPLQKNTNLTISNGNLDAVGTGSNQSTYGTIGVASGKWYWEVTANGGMDIGIANASGITLTTYVGSTASSYAYDSNGQKYTNGSGSAYGASFTTNDVIGVAFDADAGTLTFYKNGISQGQAFSSLTSGPYFPGFSTATASYSANFGQRAFAHPVSGFKALCDTNIPEGTITTSGTYTGNGVADGPFVYLNGVPTAMTVGGNAVTFGTHADKLSNGFKLRTTSTTYNQNALSYSYSITTTGAKFKYARAQPNP